MLSHKILTRYTQTSLLRSLLKPRQLFPSARFFSSYPDHEVVGMPALSPTMEVGTLASWKGKVFVVLLTIVKLN